MRHQLMLDSGAFSVRFSGKKIELADYIQFCKDHPQVSYYINFDSIPGERGSFSPYTGSSWSRGLTNEKIEYHCQQSWKNYMAMIRELPIEKVIAVYHRGENWDWLEKYLDFGCPYLAVSGINTLRSGMDNKVNYVTKIAKRVLDSSGKLVTKVHGLAVTDWKMIRFLPWTSVDSASWTKSAGFGNVFIPRSVNGQYDYSKAPIMLSISPRQLKSTSEQHFETSSPIAKQYVLDYLSSLGIGFGRYEIVCVQQKHKLRKDELWFNKQKTKVMKILELGISTCHQRRYYVNALFMICMNRVIPTECVYLAGTEGSIAKGMERRFPYRLMSYFQVRSKKSNSYKNFRFHLDLIEGKQASNASK